LKELEELIELRIQGIPWGVIKEPIKNLPNLEVLYMDRVPGINIRDSLHSPKLRELNLN
jgi:hypothetical protein